VSTTARLIESSATMPALSTPHSRRSGPLRTSLLAYGQPWIWLFGGALAICLVMIAGLLLLVLWNGLPAFWPQPIVAITTHSGVRLLGEVVRTDAYRPDAAVFNALPEALRPAARQYVAGHGGEAERRLVRIGNFELTQMPHRWVSDFEVQGEPTTPEWAVVLEREEHGRFYGIVQAFLIHGKSVADDPATAWAEYEKYHGAVRDRSRQITHILHDNIGALNRREKEAQDAASAAQYRFGTSSQEHHQALQYLADVKLANGIEQARYDQMIADLGQQNEPYRLRLVTADGKIKDIPLAQIVRAYPANQLGFWNKLGIYFSRWGEYIADTPRNANTEGGIFPCIWGTLVLTLTMTPFAVIFGVLAALYLREYARPGLLVSAIRIAVNNLAGVPSVVFGVFGLGFFCYLIGGTIDQVFFPYRLPSPTFGTGGLLWASLTLALLTVPVVIVATEEALAAVPRSMREGSYACGASKWQTIRRIVLPRAMPGIMTGMILAMARAAGEVAPLMLVGAVKYAPELPGWIDGVAPYVHVERSFMHLGYHIYDVGFQSPDSESSRPMVFVTTLLLITIVALLNIGAMWLRNHLRRKYKVSHF